MPNIYILSLIITLLLTINQVTFANKVNEELVLPITCFYNNTNSPRCCILCIHGLGLNSRSFSDFGKIMSNNQIAVYAFDIRGFGLRQDACGKHSLDFAGSIKDTSVYLEFLHKLFPQLPVFLLGESMGGALALQTTYHYPQLVDGLIASVPSNTRYETSKMDLNVALHFLLGPTKPYYVGLKVINQATLNPQLKASWIGDPLDNLKLSPIELIEFDSFMRKNHKAAKGIFLTPVLFLQGNKDRLVKPMSTLKLFTELNTIDKEIFMVSGQEHLILEDGQFNNTIIYLLKRWLLKHLD